jgi:hypothetical protein
MRHISEVSQIKLLIFFRKLKSTHVYSNKVSVVFLYGREYI